MRVKYRCNACKAEHAIDVPTRPAAVDVGLWLEGVSRRVAAHHAIASPVCMADKFDLMIPTGEDAPHIGAETENAYKPMPSFDELTKDKGEGGE